MNRMTHMRSRPLKASTIAACLVALLGASAFAASAQTAQADNSAPATGMQPGARTQVEAAPAQPAATAQADSKHADADRPAQLPAVHRHAHPHRRPQDRQARLQSEAGAELQPQRHRSHRSGRSGRCAAPSRSVDPLRSSVTKSAEGLPALAMLSLRIRALAFVRVLAAVWLAGWQRRRSPRRSRTRCNRRRWSLRIPPPTSPVSSKPTRAGSDAAKLGRDIDAASRRVQADGVRNEIDRADQQLAVRPRPLRSRSRRQSRATATSCARSTTRSRPTTTPGATARSASASNWKPSRMPEPPPPNEIPPVQPRRASAA